MPWLHVNVLHGRDDATLRRLAEVLSRETARELGVPVERVRVIISEYPASRWAVGGVPISELDR